MPRPRPTPPPAKITRPRAGAVAARPRLFAALRAALARARVVWIAGPPGAGKTTLVSSYLERTRARHVWYQIDAGDRDPGTVFHYLGAAARAAGRRRALPALTPERAGSLAVFSRRWFEALARALGAPSVIVLDDYHELEPDSRVHEDVVAAGAAALPPGVSLVVLSRAEPPACFARLRAEGALATLPRDALALTPREARAVARLRARGALDRGALGAIEDRARGWAAGVVLLAEAAATRAAPAPGDADPAVLFDYFATEVLREIPAGAQRVLLETALLPTVGAAAAARLTGDPGAGAVLADLWRAGTFTVRLGGAPVYQYHPLFRAFLLRRAGEVLPAARRAALPAEAAALLEGEGRPDDAAELLMGAASWEALADLAVRWAPSLLAQARHATLERWLRAVPPEIGDGRPWIACWLGACRILRNADEARGWFERAYAAFDARDDAAGLYLSWAGAVDAIYLSWLDLAPLSRWIARLAELRARHPRWPSPEIEARVVTSAVIALVNHRPDHPDLAAWIRRAEGLLQALPPSPARLHLAAQLALHACWTGELRRAGALLDDAAPRREVVEAAPLSCAWAVAVRMVHAWESLAPREALALLDEGLAVGRASGTDGADHALRAQAVYAALLAGDAATAEACLEALETAAPRGAQRPRAHHLHLRAVLDLHAGRPARAVERAREAIAAATAGAVPFAMANTRLALAAALVEARAPRAEAAAHVAAARAIGAGMRSRQIAAWCDLLEARAAHLHGDRDGARAALQSGLAASRAMGGAAMYYLPRPALAALYAEAIAAGIEADHARDVARRLALVPEDRAAAPDGWPWPLRIRTLGRFELARDDGADGPAPGAGRGGRRPLELLAALVALGGRDVSPERLAAALWPEAEGDAARRAFDTTLHRLRKLLPPGVLVLRDGRTSLDASACWVDLWALEEAVSRLDALVRAGTPEDGGEVARLTARVLDLYRGPFLRDEREAAWILPVRERVRSRVLRQVAAAGLRDERSGRWDAACDLYQRALEVEPVAEELYRGLMRCHLEAGRAADVLQTYQRCRLALAALRVAPSPTTEELRRRATS